MLAAVVQNARAALKSRLGPFVKSLAPKRIDPPLATWGLSTTPEGRLAYEGQDLHALLDRFGSPLHVVLGRRLDENAAMFLAKPAGAERAPEVYYSYKTNPIPGVLTRLHAQGIGAEVISPYELWLALQLGVEPAKIVFNGPAKSDDSIEMALAARIGLFNINHIEEVERVARAARRLGVRPRVGVRISLSSGWAGQFGAGDGPQALAAFRAALACADLDVVGLHAHLGQSITNERTLHGYLDEVLAFADVLYAQTGFFPEVLDVGGSLGARMVAPLTQRAQVLNRAFHADLVPPSPARRLDARSYCAMLCRRVEAHARAAGHAVPRVFIEPGRALTSDAQLMLTRVVTTKDDGDVTWAILDAGVNLAECVKHEYHQLFAANRYADRAVRPHRLAGPICTPGDVLYASWQLPLLNPGDSLAIMDAGAYFVPFATSFSFPKPAVVCIEGGRVRPLRRGETFADLVALDVTTTARRDTNGECAPSSPAGPASSAPISVNGS
jgi:diaminopimelate decarboxylase